MTYTFKLARRTSRLKFAICSVLLLPALACNQDDPAAPSEVLTPAVPEAAASGDTVPVDTTAPDSGIVPGDEVIEEGGFVDQGAPVEAEGSEAAADLVNFSFAGFSAAMAPSQLRKSGIPFGDFHLPTNVYGQNYSGSLVALWPSTTMKKLGAARAAGMRIVISMAGSRSGYTDRGRFNLSKWKAHINKYKKYNFTSYINDGTIIGHYLVDEPGCAGCWGGREITASQIDQMARYSKSLWPKLATAVRAAPSGLPRPISSRLDFAWAQWEGPHVPSHGLTPEKFRDKEVAAAKARGLGLVFGLNYVNGGSGSSKILGTYKNSRKVNRWAMSAAEVRKVAGVFAASSYACAVLSWKYDTKVLSRSGMKSAIAYVAGVARSRGTSSCRK